MKLGARSLYVGNGQHKAVEAVGVFHICLLSGLEIVLNNCHYAPSITRGVISVSRLYEDSFVNCFMNNTIQVSRNNMVYFSAIPRDDIFEIDLSNSYANDSSMYDVSNKRAKLDLDSALLWHYRLGHISKKRIEKLQHDELLNSTDLRAFEKCVPCMSGKMARKPYTHQVERAKDLLGLIHTDVCGPFKIMSRQGASYFVTFTDDFSRYRYVYLLKHKHEVFETFKVFQKEVENQLGKTIKLLRSDRGGEYMSQEFLDHLKDHGIIAYRTPPYTPQHNGVSDRRNKTLLDTVRSMMSQTTLPKSFEALVKRDTLTKPDKLEPRSIKCIFIGYPKETMGYSFYFPPENKVLLLGMLNSLVNRHYNQEESGEKCIEDWVSDDEDDDEPNPKVEKKTIIPTATKKEFVKPEKPVKSCPKHMVPRVVLMKTGLKPVNTARPVNTVRSVNTGRPFSTARSFNTVRPSYTAHPKSTVHCARPRTYFQNQAQSTVHRPFYKKTSLTNRCLNKRFNTDRPVRSTVNTVRERVFNASNSQLNDKGFVDSGCSRHMTGNIAHLLDFKDFDRGYVTFGGGAYGGRITGTSTIKTGNLDFDDVYFVKELKFNLFSVSQMCDKKNYVLFTDSECLVLSPNFKLPDENHLKDHGIITHRTPPYTPQHNGVSKRRNRTLLDLVRSMMRQTTLPKPFWDYALETAARILNMVPTKKVEKTPYKNSLITQEASVSLEDLKIIQEEDTHPSIDTSLHHEEDDLEIDEPQSNIIPIRRSTRIRNAPNRMCLYIDDDEHELGDLGLPANYKAALLDPESDK
ncbi:retrotransposon protein, putative, ty1-copia subclass [Tanacetum coccineum]